MDITEEVADTLEKLSEQLRNIEPPPTYTVEAAAKKAKIPYSWLRKEIYRNKIPKVYQPGWNAPRFGDADIPWLQFLYERRNEHKIRVVKVPQGHGTLTNTDGLFNQCEAARYLDMPLITLISWMKSKVIPPPSHKGKGGFLCWTLQELEGIKKSKASYFANQSVVLL